MRIIFCISRALRVVRPCRTNVAQTLELAGFAAVSCGTRLLAGLGAALVVAGLLLVLKAFEVDR